MESDETNQVTPAEIKGWSWGAFMYNIFWGIGNKTYLPLLCLIPIFNIVWVFVCGFKGNEWAWEKGDYKDVETFKAVQATWNRAGFVQFIISIIFIAVYILSLILIFSTMSHNSTY